jgi:signal transduction histidine kinase
MRSAPPRKNKRLAGLAEENAQIGIVRNEPIAAVSHELRTPLTSIRGALALVVSGAAGPLPAKAKELLEIALRNSERLIHIVNDILDAEKIESGQMRISMQPVMLAPFLAEALAYNQPYAEKFKVRFRLENFCGDAEIKADPDRLMQVLANLLSNAAKFSPAGAEVILRAREDAGKIVLEVEDFGSGIPCGFQPRIFEKFAQAENAAAPREGTGLGLHLSRQLVELMGGDIDFRTEIGKGTVFFVRFPCATSIRPEVA